MTASIKMGAAQCDKHTDAVVGGEYGKIRYQVDKPIG